MIHHQPRRAYYPAIYANRDARSLAHMAALAWHDVQFGGARALVMARRLESMGSDLDYDAVVSDAYTSSDGVSRRFAAFECDECGQTHGGVEAASDCCDPRLDLGSVDFDDEGNPV